MTAREEDANDACLSNNAGSPRRFLTTNSPNIFPRDDVLAQDINRRPAGGEADGEPSSDRCSEL